MALPRDDTAVDYPIGATSSAGTVLHTEETERGLAIVLDRTAFHPLDGHWPDQPADRGHLHLDGGPAVPIVDALVGATEGERLFVGDDVPVRTGTAGWAFVVVHLAPRGSAVREGDTVRVVVDSEYRAALSIGHTACHLAALALDRALADAWTKTVPVDSLGSPAFDMLAIETSEIVAHGARDTYRIGRSLRKKGFDAASFDDAAAVAARVDEVLAAWTASDASVHVDVPDAALSARRSWVCDLPEGEARIPCGGTHVPSLADLGRVSVSLDVEDVEGARRVVMTTTATG